jgi:hypothetical protein
MPECRSCKSNLPTSNFPKNKSYKTGHATICKPCSALVAAEYRKTNYNKVYAHKYGITEEHVEQLLKLTYCEICGKQEDRRRLSIDHCHKTGEVRGMLCDSCNTGLGKFRDDRTILNKARNYLEKYGK